MRPKTLLHLVLLAGLILAGCTSNDREVIRIGLVADISGGLPAIGASCRYAAELAVDEINNQGGLAMGGRKYTIELLVEDNAGDIETTKEVTGKLINKENVIAVIGPNASRFAITAAEVAENAKVALISTW